MLGGRRFKSIVQDARPGEEVVYFLEIRGVMDNVFSPHREARGI